MPKVSGSTVGEIRNAQRRLERFLKKLDTVPTEILLEEAARIEAEIKLETPVDTGLLQQSAKCQVVKRGAVTTLKASASQKNKQGTYDYAQIQHDTLTYKHPNGGKARYVADPFNRGVLRIKQRLQQEVKYD